MHNLLSPTSTLPIPVFVLKLCCSTVYSPLYPFYLVHLWGNHAENISIGVVHSTPEGQHCALCLPGSRCLPILSRSANNTGNYDCYDLEGWGVWAGHGADYRVSVMTNVGISIPITDRWGGQDRMEFSKVTFNIYGVLWQNCAYVCVIIVRIYVKGISIKC